MFNGAAVVRRTALSEKVFAKAEQEARERRKRERAELELRIAKELAEKAAREERRQKSIEAARRAQIEALPQSKVRMIQTVTANYYDLSVDELLCQRREKMMCEARQVAMWLAKKHTLESFPAIGMHFKRDHTTILHGAGKIEALLKHDEKLKARVLEIEKLLPFGEKA